MYGCNNFCSYCIVPYARGRERSRQPSDIIDEVRRLGQEGYKEVTLLGQKCKNSMVRIWTIHTTFPIFLMDLDKIHGIERIRFMTSHPKDFI